MAVSVPGWWSPLKAFVTFCLTVRTYCIVTIALQYVPVGKLEDFDPTLHYGNSLTIIILHCFMMRGATRTTWFMVSTAVLSYLAEQLGVSTGGVFGEYVYPPGKLGAKLGHVPLCIPFSWISTLYAAQAVSNAVLDGGRVSGVAPRSKQGLARVALLTVADAAVMTMYDMGTDPLFVHNGYWTWLGAPSTLPFHGVPLQNFAGWFATGLAASAASRGLDWVLSRKQGAAGAIASGAYGRAHLVGTAFACVPLVYLGAEAVSLAYGAVPPGDTPLPSLERRSLGLVVTFTSVLWVLMAFGQVLTASSPPAAAKSNKTL